MFWPAVDSDQDKKERPLGVRPVPPHSRLYVSCVVKALHRASHHGHCLTEAPSFTGSCQIHLSLRKLRSQGAWK